MNPQNMNRLRVFLELGWYDELIKFLFNFVTKTSELLLAAGVVVSTANFLTDGSVMHGHKALSDAWSWAQALAIDSSLGIVFTTAIQAVHERDKMKAGTFFALTALLATVAGLLTHFDSLAHAANLAVSDPGISGGIPLWVLTALRAIAVISFLLASRLKDVSFISLQQEWKLLPEKSENMSSHASTIPTLDYTTLATSIVEVMHQHGMISSSKGQVEPLHPLLSSSKGEALDRSSLKPSSHDKAAPAESTIDKIIQAYEQLLLERSVSQNLKPISARDLAKRANVRRSTCSEWLQNYIHCDQQESEQILTEHESFSTTATSFIDS